MFVDLLVLWILEMLRVQVKVRVVDVMEVMLLVMVELVKLQRRWKKYFGHLGLVVLHMVCKIENDQDSGCDNDLQQLLFRDRTMVEWIVVKWQRVKLTIVVGLEVVRKKCVHVVRDFRKTIVVRKLECFVIHVEDLERVDLVSLVSGEFVDFQVC